MRRRKTEGGDGRRSAVRAHFPSSPSGTNGERGRGWFRRGVVGGSGAGSRRSRIGTPRVGRAAGRRGAERGGSPGSQLSTGSSPEQVEVLGFPEIDRIDQRPDQIEVKRRLRQRVLTGDFFEQPGPSRQGCHLANGPVRRRVIVAQHLHRQNATGAIQETTRGNIRSWLSSHCSVALLKTTSPGRSGPARSPSRRGRRTPATRLCARPASPRNGPRPPPSPPATGRVRARAAFYLAPEVVHGRRLHRRHPIEQIICGTGAGPP